MSLRRLGGFIGELKRRHVFRVAMVYAAVAFVVVQVADIAFPALGIADWALALVIVLAALGFPMALVFAWAYDLTPAGIKRAASLSAPADWPQVRDVLNAALELPSGERPAFVARACVGNPELRREVQSLLAAHARPGVLDRPAAELAAPLIRSGPESAPVRGRTIGNYHILDKLGSGGMGVVYKARDLRLERIVALKFLPPHLSTDDHAKERFLVEAQAAAALDHPNICTIHEIGETEEGHLFLAMPFYGGETLKRQLAQGPLSIEQAIDVAIQAAHGLTRAHERGIIHRDIKPANLIVTGEGVVKIVDFGVAKLADISLTNPGMTPGTVAYMSPEQARGEEVDGRTDLWSLGVVLYEMLTGERPFRGAHDGVLLHTIQTTDPQPITTLRPGIPAALEQVVNRTLAKHREDRYPSAHALVQALEGVRFPATERRSIPIVGGSVAPAAPLDSGETSSGGVLPEGERRQATVVASTLSGYDALVESLVPEEVELAIGMMREVATEVAARHGGALNRFTGDEMVLIFGIPTTQEDDGVRAVRAALELHARVRALSEPVEQKGGPALRLHTGIDTGRIVAQPGESGESAYRITGAPLQIAGRIATHAGTDEVWASPECQHLIGPFFETEPEEPLVVRDRKQPLIPYRVLGDSGLQTRLEAAEKVGLTAYTGRAAELATLRRSLEDALQGEGQFVTVVGEAGMGKSRLLHEFRQSLDGEQLSLVLGRCQSYGGGVAYLPFIEILRTGLRLGEPGAGGALPSTLARIREIGPELEEFIPLYLHLLSIPSTEFPVPAHLQGDAFRLAMQEALAAILTLIARRQPSVMLLEDWHWADAASHAVLRQVAEVVSGYSLLVVVTCRPGYGTEWGSPSQHTPVSLRPLEPPSSVEVLKSLLHVDDFPGELGTLLHERTGGNPFFLEEICQALLEEGSIRIEGREALLTGPLQLLDLPDSIQAVIRARLDRLDRGARDVLRLASVVGREFTREILERTASEGDPLAQALATLKAAALIQQIRVVPDALYRFKHVLTQEVAYASLLEHQRRDLHGRVGAAIEQLHQDRIEEYSDRLAHHFSRAEEWHKAVHYGMRSAERSSALAQFAEALQILERTQRWLSKLPAGAQRRDALTDILLRQERLCETLGLRLRQQQIIDELISLFEPDGDRAKLAEIYLRQGDLHTLLRRFDEAEAALNRSLHIRRELADPVGERNTLRSLGLLRWHEGRNEEALHYAEESLALARKRGDLAAIFGDLTNMGAILRALGELQPARDLLEEGLRLAESASRDGSVAARIEDELSTKQVYALQHLANIHRELGDSTRALECLHRAGELAEGKRLPIQLSYHYTSIAHVHLQQGDVEESLRYYRQAVDLTRRAKYAPGLAQSLRILGEVLVGLERREEALPYLLEAAGVFAQLRDSETEALIWSMIAGVHQEARNHAEAMAAWGKARMLRREANDLPGELEALEGLAQVTRRQVAEPSLALGYHREALELAEALEDQDAEGRLRNTLGILEWNRGEYAQALQQYERAYALFHGLGDQVHAGLMLNSVGITLKALGRLDEARRRFEEAVTVHRQTGQRQLEGHALAALGDISTELGDTECAAEYYQQSLEIRRDIGDRRGEGWMLYNLARNDVGGGQGRELALHSSQIADECGDHELATACEQLRRMSGY
jgi:tetratricopeptide (TPR) repeat protein/class 3 adenylate cyclase